MRGSFIFAMNMLAGAWALQPMTCRRNFLAAATPALVAVNSPAAFAATSEELKGLLGSAQEEIIEAPKARAAEKKKKEKVDTSPTTSNGNPLDFSSIAEKAKAEGRARAEARRAELAGTDTPIAKKAAPTPSSSSDNEAVYAELRAKREAKKEAAAAKLAEKKKNLTPLEEFRATRDK